MKKIIASIFVLLVMLNFACYSNTQNSTCDNTDNSFSESISAKNIVEYGNLYNASASKVLSKKQKSLTS